jgi:UDP-N-acetyl-D-mannosaminuronate dehydrogenase
MHTVKAVVKNGRLVVDEPTTLPDGTEYELQLVDTGDDLDDEQRVALHRSIAIGLEQARRGEVQPADQVLRELRARK